MAKWVRCPVCDLHYTSQQQFDEHICEQGEENNALTERGRDLIKAGMCVNCLDANVEKGTRYCPDCRELLRSAGVEEKNLWEDYRPAPPDDDGPVF